ncbi:MAG: DUF1080 domain-containing protein [Sedimentisphaerales bacterium]|nr:DUF1080 domain-containing protein [Sedimentisphaerales bacterium]
MADVTIDSIGTSRRLLICGICWILAVGGLCAFGEGRWQDLFDGKSLDGWVQRGGKAEYRVADGAIVGQTVLDTANSFLCTGKEYGDFVLEFEFLVDQRLNSGVQIRSQCFDHPTQVQWQGRTISIPAGRVHGYQVEIDPDVPRGRMWTAGIYDEGRRGWLFPADGEQGQQGKAFSQQGMKIFRPNQWNHVRVEAIGYRIRTWLNGTPCADIEDSMTTRGFIALQVHSIGNDRSKLGAQVKWRNIKIMEVTEPGQVPNSLTLGEIQAGWRLLWDGVSTKGWRSARAEGFPEKGWQIEDGVLKVLGSGGAEAAAGGDIITVDRYSNFELLVDFRLTPGANSGIKYMVQPNLDPVTGTGVKAATGSAIGLEFQLLDDQLHPDAKLGRDGNRTLGSLYDLLPASSSKKPNPIGQWNTARILVKGDHVEHWLNGQKILEYDRASGQFAQAVAQSKFRNIPGFGRWQDGHILLQEHGDEVWFRNIKIRILENSQ